MKKNIALFLSLFFFLQQSFASSCCGSSIAMPSLITTGERWKFQTIVSESERVFQVMPDSEAIKLSTKNQLAVFKTQIKSGYRFDNDFQVFGQINYFDRGAGDMDFGFGQELKFSDDYGTFVWAQLTIPTGKSIYKITDPEEQPTGTGFWTPGVGASLFKTFGTWDASLSAFAGHGFSEKFNGQTITPGWQSFAQIAGGKSFGEWRAGLSIEYQRENGKKIQAGGQSEDSYSWPVTLSASYLHKGDIWTVSLSDETLLGPTQNTYLNHALSLSYVKRFF